MDKGGRTASAYVWAKNGGHFAPPVDGKTKCEFPVAVPDDEATRPCGVVYAVHTGHMANHLERDHSWTRDDWSEKQLKGMKAGIDKALVAGSILLAPAELENQQTLLAVALAEGLHPVSLFAPKQPHTLYTGDGSVTVERFGLGDWLHQLLPQFKPGSYHTLQTRLEKFMETSVDVDTKFLVMQMLGNGFTIDGFVAQMGLYYHSVTTHGVIMVKDRIFFLSFLLGCNAFPEGDAKSEASHFIATCDQWGIDKRKRLAITLDGAERATAREAEVPSLWCVAHLINLAVHNVLEWPVRTNNKVPEDELVNYPLFSRQAWELVDKAKRTVRHFSSRKNWDELSKAHKEVAGANAQLLTLKSDVATRWSSELTLIISVLESIKSQDLYWRWNGNKGRILMSVDAKMLEEMVCLLQAPAAVTTQIQGWSYPTGAGVVLKFIKCITYWRDVAKDDLITTALIREVRSNLIQSFRNRVKALFDHNKVLSLALLAFTPQTWAVTDGVYDLAAMWDAHQADFAGVCDRVQTGQQLMESIYEQLLGCLRLYSPARLAQCVGGLFTAPAAAAAAANGQDAAPEALFKRSKSLVSSYFAKKPPTEVVEFPLALEKELSLFVSYCAELVHLEEIEFYQTLIARQACPRVAHVGLAFLGVTGANAASESVFSDANWVTSGRRARTSSHWADLQLRTHRNFSTVKKMRELVGAKAGQTLESALGGVGGW
jgi:hypothetical protein